MYYSCFKHKLRCMFLYLLNEQSQWKQFRCCVILEHLIIWLISQREVSACKYFSTFGWLRCILYFDEWPGRWLMLVQTSLLSLYLLLLLLTFPHPLVQPLLHLCSELVKKRQVMKALRHQAPAALTSMWCLGWFGLHTTWIIPIIDHLLGNQNFKNMWTLMIKMIFIYEQIFYAMLYKSVP